MTKIAEVNQLKNRMAVVSSDPVMESQANIGTLHSILVQEQQACKQALLENTTLNNKLSQAKSTLATLQQQYDDLTAKKKNQEGLAAKIDFYLTDFKGGDHTNSVNELVKKLAGDLSKVGTE